MKYKKTFMQIKNYRQNPIKILIKITFVKKLKQFEIRCYQLFLIVLDIWKLKRISNEILSIFSLSNALLLFLCVRSINVNNMQFFFLKSKKNFKLIKQS